MGLVAGLEEVLKGNSRVNIEQRRRVQHLEKFRILRVPVRPKRRDSVSGFFSFFFGTFFFGAHSRISTNRGGKK